MILNYNNNNKIVYAWRTCQENGSWMSSNYSECLRALGQAIKNSNASDDTPYRLITTFTFIGFCIACIPVMLAITIFISIRSLRCLRNMIHCNMLLTFFFKSAIYIIFHLFAISRKQIWNENHVS